MPATTLPELTLIAPGDMLVDDRFQRNLSERSVDLIRRIICGVRLAPLAAARVLLDR